MIFCTGFCSGTKYQNGIVIKDASYSDYAHLFFCHKNICFANDFRYIHRLFDGFVAMVTENFDHNITFCFWFVFIRC